MSEALIISIIFSYSLHFGVDPKVALAVALQESNLNPNAIGEVGEIGIYQLRSEYVKGFTKQQLKDPIVNISLGIERLKEMKENCVHKEDLTYLVCYNYGLNNAKYVRYPKLWPYVLQVKERVKNINSKGVANVRKRR